MKVSRRKFFLIIGDILIIFLSLETAYFIRLDRHIPLNNMSILSISFISLIYILSFYIFDFYNINRKLKLNRMILNLLGAIAFVSTIIVVYFYVIPYQLGRGIFLISLILIGISVIIWRILFSSFLKMAVIPRKVLIVGAGEAGQIIYSIIKNNSEYEVIGFVDNNRKKDNLTESNILGDPLSLEKIVEENKVDDIVLSIEPTKKKGLNASLINCKMKGTRIIDMPTFFEHLTNKLPISYIKEKWFLYADGFSKTGDKIYLRLKRLLDLFISTVLLICLLPLGLIVSLAVKLSSRGSIFYIQERLGENSHPFKLIKFRTMIEGAEKREPKWAEEKDLRVTKIGRILRRLRFDEVPQLINVMKGDMSLIGPRPEREYFVKKLTEEIPFYSLRFSVKPGLTGWAQVNFRYGASLEDTMEKLSYDLYYIKNMSLFLDIRILLKTIRSVLFALGR